jgi:hypothetical protein
MTKNLRSRFVNDQSLDKLTVYMRHAKSGNINVGVSFKKDGEKTINGKQKSFVVPPMPDSTLASHMVNDKFEQEARDYFNELVAEAKTAGWTVKARPEAKVRVPKRITFDAIPAPTPVPNETVSVELIGLDVEEPAESSEHKPTSRRRRNAAPSVN